MSGKALWTGEEFRWRSTTKPLSWSCPPCCLTVEPLDDRGGGRELGTPGEAADPGHVSLDAFAQVLQQMKAISDLSSLRRSLPNALCVKTAALAADDFDFRMLLDPIRSLFGGARF